MVISATGINKIYLDCLLTNNERYHDCISVPGFIGQAHVFHTERLNDQYLIILTAIKKLPRVMLHSQSPGGVPWIIARRHDSGFDGCTLLTADRLLSMGIALGMVRVVKSLSAAYDVPYVVIDDDRLIRQERMKDPQKRIRKIARWHK